MATDLDRLLASIDPSRTIDRITAEIDRAFNSFPMNRTTIKDLNDYENYLADFFRHIESVSTNMGNNAPVNREAYWARCSRILDKEFGPNGWKTAFELVRTGKEGGLYRLLKTIAEKMAEQYWQNEISARIGQYWNNLTVDEMMAAIDEYLEKYGHLLPSELTEGPAGRVRTNFFKVLEEHPKLIRHLRHVVSD